MHEHTLPPFFHIPCKIPQTIHIRYIFTYMYTDIPTHETGIHETDRLDCINMPGNHLPTTAIVPLSTNVFTNIITNIRQPAFSGETSAMKLKFYITHTIYRT